MEHDRVKNIIHDFFKNASFLDGDLSFSHDEKNNTLWATLKTGDHKLFTGKNHDTLQAVSTLIKRLVEKSFETEPGVALPPSVIFDVNDIQKKRIEQLRTLAHMLAERARFFKSNVEVDPMSPFERRIVHEFLTEYNDLKTESEGEGPKRHIVIKYIGSSDSL